LTAIENVCVSAGAREPELDFHFNRQYPSFYAERGLLADEIVDVQHLNEALTRINQRYAISYIPLMFNETRYATSGRVGSRINVPSVSLASEQLVSRESFVARETLALVRNAHSLDYEGFGFPDAPGWAEKLLRKS
jgi:hypothetical protein